MLTNTKNLKGFVIRATDGELGTVDQFYFDDETWAIRYLTVDTGGWLGGRRVLISPISVIHTDWQAKRLDVALTKNRSRIAPTSTRTSPSPGSTRPHTSGITGIPIIGVVPICGARRSIRRAGCSNQCRFHGSAGGQGRRESADSHLRSTEAVTGYHIEAADGEIGHVDGFVVDDEAWAIRYIEVATRNWWPGKKVLVSPAWIERVSWTDSKVYVGLSREAIKDAPEYVESRPITREYENRLYFHYGRPPYWLLKGAQVFSQFGWIPERRAGVYLRQRQISPGQFGFAGDQLFEGLDGRRRVLTYKCPRAKAYKSGVFRMFGQLFPILSRQGCRFGVSVVTRSTSGSGIDRPANVPTMPESRQSWPPDPACSA
jgi:hypothetical protein